MTAMSSWTALWAVADTPWKSVIDSPGQKSLPWTKTPAPFDKREKSSSQSFRTPLLQALPCPRFRCGLNSRTNRTLDNATAIRDRVLDLKTKYNRSNFYFQLHLSIFLNNPLEFSNQWRR